VRQSEKEEGNRRMGRDDIYRFVAFFFFAAQPCSEEKKIAKIKNFSSLSRAKTAFALVAMAVEATNPIGSVSTSG
jgi:hypothetical protein